MTKTNTPCTLCPAPDCGEVVTSRNTTILDERKRPWHKRCAEGALSSYFRTPLDLEAIDGERVEFKVLARPEDRHVDLETKLSYWTMCFQAPHEFLLRSFIFDGDYAVVGAFNGAMNIFASAPNNRNAYVTGDFPNLSVPVNQITQVGHTITVNVLAREINQPPPCFTIIGERMSPKRRIDERTCTTAFGLESAPSLETNLQESCFLGYIHTHFERLASDDWQGWEVVHVEVGGGPGTAYQEVKKVPMNLPLTGRATVLPIFNARAREPVKITLRDSMNKGRTFTGRIYGQGLIR